MKTIKVSDEAFKFLCYLARQDVTLPAVLVEYLKWPQFTKEQIRNYLHEINDACQKEA